MLAASGQGVVAEGEAALDAECAAVAIPDAAASPGAPAPRTERADEPYPINADAQNQGAAPAEVGREEQVTIPTRDPPHARLRASPRASPPDLAGACACTGRPFHGSTRCG